MYSYDNQNVFAKIIRKELDCNLVYEDDYTISFHDKYPVAPKHILVIPKGSYVSYDHFVKNAKHEEIVSFFKAIQFIVEVHSLVTPGYRLVSNNGKSARQVVMHFHMHIISGKEFDNSIEKC